MMVQNTTFLAPRFWSHPGWYVRKGCRCDYTYGIARVGGAEADQKNRGLGIDDFQWANGDFGIDQELALKQCADRMFMHRVW